MQCVSNFQGSNNGKSSVNNEKCQPGTLDLSDNTHLDEMLNNLENETHTTKEIFSTSDSLHNGSALEDIRPIKKAKSQVDEDTDLPEVHNGTNYTSFSNLNFSCISVV